MFHTWDFAPPLLSPRNIHLDIKTTNRSALVKTFKADTEAHKRVVDVKST